MRGKNRMTLGLALSSHKGMLSRCCHCLENKAVRLNHYNTGGLALFNGDAFARLQGLIDIGAAKLCDVIEEEFVKAAPKELVKSKRRLWQRHHIGAHVGKPFIVFDPTLINFPAARFDFFRVPRRQALS